MIKFLLLRLRRTFRSLWFAAALISAFSLSAATVFFIQNIMETFSGSALPLLETFRLGSSYDLIVLKVSSTDLILRPEWGKLLRCILGSSAMTVLTAAAVSRNVTAMFRHGEFFRAAAKGISHSAMFGSAALCALLLTAALSAAYTLGFVLTAAVSGISMGAAPLSETLRVLLTQSFMLACFSMICTAVSVVLRNPIAAILTNISLAAGLPAAFLYLRIVLRIPADLNTYWLLSRLSALADRAPVPADLLSAVLPAAAAYLCGQLILNRINLKHE